MAAQLDESIISLFSQREIIEAAFSFIFTALSNLIHPSFVSLSVWLYRLSISSFDVHLKKRSYNIRWTVSFISLSCASRGSGVAHMGLWLAAGHLNDKEDKVWERRETSLHPEGAWLQGSCRTRAVFVWLPGLGAWGRIFAELAKSFCLCRGNLYTSTYILPTAWAVATFKWYFYGFRWTLKAAMVVVLPLPSPLPLNFKSFPSRSTLFGAKLESIFFD